MGRFATSVAIVAIGGLAIGASLLGRGWIDRPVVITHPKTVAAGGVAAAWLDDNTPVFVVQNDDGPEIVLAAVSPHRPGGWLGSAVVWCPRSQSFEEPRWGSHFDADGDWQSGPAPHGLDTHAASFNGTRVSVVGEVRPGRPRDLSADPPVGPSCPGLHEPNEHDPWPVGTVAHDTSSTRALGAVVDASNGNLELTTGSIRYRAGDTPVVCAGGCWPVATDDRSDDDAEIPTTPMLVRARAGQIVEVILLTEVRRGA